MTIITFLAPFLPPFWKASELEPDAGTGQKRDMGTGQTDVLYWAAMKAATVGTPVAQSLHHNALAPVGQLGLEYAHACVCMSNACVWE